MISLTLSQELKSAGLQWVPALHDFFAIPDRGFDYRVFVISDLSANIENLLGESVVAFQGAPEWALDYLVTSEAVWLPTEAQLREALERRLPSADGPGLFLISSLQGHRCEISLPGQRLAFEETDASDAYGRALLYLLQNSSVEPGESGIGRG